MLFILKVYLFILLFLVSLIILTRYIYKYYINNYKISNRSSDQIFSDNVWNMYMLSYFKFIKSDNCNFKKFIKNTKKNILSWEENMVWYKDFNIRGIFEYDKTKSCTDIYNDLNNSVPPLVDGKLLPFKIIFLKKYEGFVLLLNHYYCDGLVLHDMIIHNFMYKENYYFLNTVILL